MQIGNLLSFIDGEFRTEEMNDISFIIVRKKKKISSNLLRGKEKLCTFFFYDEAQIQDDLNLKKSIFKLFRN